MDKTKLISLIKTGGIKKVPYTEAHKNAITKSVMFGEKLLARKKTTLSGLRSKIPIYKRLITSLGIDIERKKAKIKILLEQSKTSIYMLRLTTSKKEIIDHAMIIGSNKTHIEILKRKISANMSKIKSYKEMQDSAIKSSQELKTDLTRIDATIKTKGGLSVD